MRASLLPLVIGAACALGALGLGTFRLVVVSSDSMADTLCPGDYVVVERVNWITLRLWPKSAAPQRGDVIVFRAPFNKGELLVKRVDAVGGDRVVMYRGGVEVKSASTAAGRVYGKRPPRPAVPSMANAGSDPGIQVPQGRYFVVGDNLRVSYDSRYWGMLPRGDVVGIVRLVLRDGPRVAGGQCSAQANGPI